MHDIEIICQPPYLPWAKKKTPSAPYLWHGLRAGDVCQVQQKINGKWVMSSGGIGLDPTGFTQVSPEFDTAEQCAAWATMVEASQRE